MPPDQPQPFLLGRRERPFAKTLVSALSTRSSADSSRSVSSAW
jgi:hypothetical protein